MTNEQQTLRKTGLKTADPEKCNFLLVYMSNKFYKVSTFNNSMIKEVDQQTAI
jgi:hypothetical protein